MLAGWSDDPDPHDLLRPYPAVADADVADLNACQQAGERRPVNPSSRSSYLPLSYVISVLRLYAFNSNNIVLCVILADLRAASYSGESAKQATAPCYPIE